MASPIVTIERIHRREDPSGRIRGCVLELPTSGGLDATYSFPVQGWIVGNGQPVAFVDVVDQYSTRLRMPVRLSRPDVVASLAPADCPQECGFASRVNTVELPPRFRIRLVAGFEGAGNSPIAVIEGTRRVLPAHSSAKIRPIMVTTIGRSGSMWLLTLLGRHPDIAVFQPQTNETRAASYFVDVLRALSRPSSYVSALRGYAVATEDWMGTRPVRALQEYEQDPQLRDWFGTAYVDELIAFVTRQLDAVYRQLSARVGKQEATHFAEKCPPNGPQVMLSEIYPDAREILLVRDFRDFVCSARSFGTVWLQNRNRYSSDEEWIRLGVAPMVRDLLVYWRTRSDKALLVKYEDLVTRTEETLVSTFAHLGVEASPSTAKFVIDEDRANRDEVAEREHQTSGGPAESIGRWKNELGPSLVRACEEAFGPALAEFGYS